MFGNTLCRVRTKIDHVAERTLFLSLSFESSYHEKHIKNRYESTYQIDGI